MNFSYLPFPRIQPRFCTKMGEIVLDILFRKLELWVPDWGGVEGNGDGDGKLKGGGMGDWMEEVWEGEINNKMENDKS